MAKKEFQAESKKLMDMMINSIYTSTFGIRSQQSRR